MDDETPGAVSVPTVEAPAAPAAEVPAEVPAPAVEPAPEVEAPAAEVPVTETPAEPMLYELPDGRKVDAETLQKEWKENFMPDYTQKSQRLAAIEKPTVTSPDDVPEWKREGYVPKSYAEIIEIARQETLAEAERKQSQEAQFRAEVATKIDTTLAEIKAADPNLDSNALFAHATRYGFSDLKAAHTNLKEMERIKLDTEQRVLKNIEKRTDPVAPVGGGNAAPTGDVPANPGDYENARDYLERHQG